MDQGQKRNDAYNSKFKNQNAELQFKNKQSFSLNKNF